ncbi:transcriptional regulator [Brachybacterium sp. P6-10-X1]|uniref:MerR family transcriptional regulator n=1 Tax=Brachybacterium sp. P6-10-X1 TaxID=1903186 RepID=UPI000971B1EC|nr:MerR family transcriptional regulator [Brachybacterium sp. P6-10-X1]APX33156.1 transcriptional regulator [Brachybacterium sp. P6-10-X1]
MRISELSATTDVPIGTIKYYLREGLLPAGRRSSRTTADYDDGHAERLRLIRALVQTGGLGIAAVRRVLAVIDDPDPQRLDVLSTAQDALTGGGGEGAEARPVDPVHAWVAARGWPTGPGDPVLEQLGNAWAACEAAGIHVDEAMMGDYADAVEQVARVDVAAVPQGAGDAVRRVVIGTIMMEPVLSALRLLAQRHVSVRQAGKPDDD